jgi:hypothetical protein
VTNLDFRRPLFMEYIRSRRSDATKEYYQRVVRRVLPMGPDEYIRLARERPMKAERIMTELVLRERRRIRATTIHSYVTLVRSFLSFYDVELNWRRITQAIPTPRLVASDRAPTLEEIGSLLKVADKRLRVIVIMLMSSGMRVGAFWYTRSGGGWDYMKFRDITFMKSGLGMVKVYPEEAEEYITFISSEAVAALKNYMAFRTKSGETLAPNSPVLTIEHHEDRHLRLKKLKMRPNVPFPSRPPLARSGVEERLGKGWNKSGARHYYRDGGFQSGKGFRVYFETVCKRAVGTLLDTWNGIDDRIATEDVELLLGHLANYHKPSVERLEQVYLKLQPLLLTRGNGRRGLADQRAANHPGGRPPEIRTLALQVEGMTKQIEAVNAKLDLIIASRGLCELK